MIVPSLEGSLPSHFCFTEIDKSHNHVITGRAFFRKRIPGRPVFVSNPKFEDVNIMLSGTTLLAVCTAPSFLYIE